VELPQTLPGQFFLLAYDRNRRTFGTHHQVWVAGEVDRGYFKFCVIWLAVQDSFFNKLDRVLIIFDNRSIAI
jgi:hypothetical protein